MWILILREIETDRISLSIVLFLGSPCIFATYLSLNRILAEKPKNKYQCNIQFYTYLIPKISLRLETKVPKLKSIFLVIYVILKNKQKTKQKQISKIEKTKILIENPKTHNKNESNLNRPNKKKIQLKVTFYTQTYKIEKKKMYRCRCQFRRSDSLNLEREWTVVGKLMVMASLRYFSLRR